jgi:hypothetical protein
MFRTNNFPLVLAALSVVPVPMAMWLCKIIDSDPSGGPAFSMFILLVLPAVALAAFLGIAAIATYFQDSRREARRSWRLLTICTFSIPSICVPPGFLIFVFLRG